MKPNQLKTQQGLSLIELMIAVVLGIFITGGMLQLFVNGNQSYRVQENLSRVQENGRFAMAFITRDLRVAGYYGCLNDATKIESNLNAGSSYDNYAIAIAGTNDDGPNDSDSISTSGMAQSGIFVVDIPASTSADLKVTDNSGLAEDDVVMVLDCTAGDLFQITNNPSVGGAAGKDEVVHNTGAVGSGPGNFEKEFQKIYGTDAQIYKARSVRYFIAINPSNQPALYQSVNGALAQELVEGIETMQILYGVDTSGPDINGLRTANYYMPATTPATVASLALMEDVVSIRVSLLSTTLEDNLATTNATTTVATYTSPDDRKVRRTFTSTIAVRNRIPQ